MLVSGRGLWGGGEGWEGMEWNGHRGGIVGMSWQIFLQVEVATYLPVFVNF